MARCAQLGQNGDQPYGEKVGFAGRIVDGFAGVQLTWPLWDGGERSDDAREKAALAHAAHRQSPRQSE